MINDWNPQTSAVLRRLDGKGILMVGDSWTQGEFEAYNHGAQSHVVVHRGLSQYLMDDGHRVHNRGIPASSNSESYWQTYAAFNLPTEATHYPKPIEDPIDYVIWFTSDPLRDIQQDEYTRRLKETGSIRQVMIDVTERWYEQFNNLSDTIGLPIYLIGGWTPVWEGIAKYKNLQSLIPCVHNLLVPGSDISFTHAAMHLYPHVRESGWFSDAVKQEIIELVDEWAYSEDVRKAHPELFFPDWEHPNRLGHYKIYETVKEKLGLT